MRSGRGLRTTWTPCALAALLCSAACSAPPPPGSDAGSGGDDAGADAGAALDAGALPGCTEDNADAGVAARDGFFEACVDPVAFPRAQCGDGSPLKLSYRDGPAAGAGLFLYFRGGGRCDGYVTCWGRDGRGGEGRTVAGLSNTARAAPRVSTFDPTAYGLFDRGEPGNALAGFAAVHVPDCTGDLGARDEVADYARPQDAFLSAPSSVRVHFRGAASVEAAVALAKARYPAASRVVLAGTGEGAYFALAALPLAASAWPAPAALTVLLDGEAGVGDAALEARHRAALQAFDGLAGRRAARFATVSFVSDPLQRAAAPPGFTSPLAFQAGLQQALAAREALTPQTFRWFAPAGACHGVAMTPGLWAQYVPWAGGLRPRQPPARPNPDLAVDGGVLEPWLFEALSGEGAYDAGFASAGGDFSASTDACLLPGALEW